MSAREFDDATLRSLVRARIDGGTLPSGEPTHVWGGYGDGRACVLCERPIGGKDVEYELVFRPNAHDVTVRLHIACYAAWQIEARGGPRDG